MGQAGTQYPVDLSTQHLFLLNSIFLLMCDAWKLPKTSQQTYEKKEFDSLITPEE